MTDLICRRRFLTISGATLAGGLLGCDSMGPRKLDPLLAFAQRKNEGLERGIFRHGSENRVPASARLTGAAFPKYFVSDELPVPAEEHRSW